MVWYSIFFSGQDWKLGIERSKTCPVAKCDGSETDRAETRVAQSMWKFIRRKKKLQVGHRATAKLTHRSRYFKFEPWTCSQYSIQNFLWFYPESFLLNTQQSSEIQKDKYIHTTHKVISLTAPLFSPVQYRNKKIPSCQLDLLFLEILLLGESMVGLFHFGPERCPSLQNRPLQIGHNMYRKSTCGELFELLRKVILSTLRLLQKVKSQTEKIQKRYKWVRHKAAEEICGAGSLIALPGGLWHYVGGG